MSRAHLAQVDLAAVHPDLAVRRGSRSGCCPFSRATAVSASGLITLMPASRTKDVVMMKKISRLRTKSSIGARSMPCLLAFVALTCRRDRIGLPRRRAEGDVRRRRPGGPGRSPARAGPSRRSASAVTITPQSGFCACSRSTLARTARTSTMRSSTRISPLGLMTTEMLPASLPARPARGAAAVALDVACRSPSRRPR